ncbi:bifunctional Fyv10 family/Protein Fyv10-E3 ubiquitin-protein transferase MAEA/Gid-type RING finger domain [Babesia duncani]|uniref:Bifunctional Fyv10 family/Protein Fyv10-E3 ubiquitin-protein transferase MAEA/Gid-type RING finger domain n=1 Tax=Babesia duncani TaxID=323732 RepID=A0AAD9PGQ9_9APIC|nr:bifunctional Fyv10 family/Protein Fyv10-E3 ubiquitin-protein transferase MAEA/Gid-type RING finger domain [Babesia duncani]KAK2197976.1 bifunctional Fyv10 family/Protein Fyv10-E3 ubiquitin-protein transferase MAEA/Gid-type RING finger domain [Babesia duncani]
MSPRPSESAHGSSSGTHRNVDTGEGCSIGSRTIVKEEKVYRSPFATRKPCRKLNIFDRSILRVPLESTSTLLEEFHRVVEHELLLITTFLIRKMPQMESKKLALEKINRALERIDNLRAILSNLDSQFDYRLEQIIDRISGLVSEPDFISEQADPNFNFSKCRFRISLVITDYLSRRQMTKTAAKLAESEGIEVFCDLKLLEESCKVIHALLKRDLEPAKRWCVEHATQISRFEPALLPELQVQEVFQRMVTGSIPTPVDDLSEYLPAEIYRASPDAKKLSLLSLFLNNGYLVHQCVEYGSVNCSIKFDASPSSFRPDCIVCQRFYYFCYGGRWDLLVQKFEECLVKVHGLEPEPTLERLIHSGFGAIKSKTCPHVKNASCPACSPQWASYIEQVPDMYKVTSTLICPVTGEFMDYNNPPLASPDGYVFSRRALELLAVKQGQRLVIECPKTRRIIPIESFKRIYII